MTLMLEGMIGIDRKLKLALWSSLNRDGQRPDSYISSSGTVTTRNPPGLMTRIQLVREDFTLTMCSRQWELTAKSKDSFSISGKNCAS